MKSLPWLYLFLAIAFAFFARVVFIPFFLSIFSAILLEPIIARVVQRGISRHFACALVVLFFLMMSGVGLWLGFISLSSLASGISGFPEKLGHLTIWLQRVLAKVDLPTQSMFLKSAAQENIQKVQVVELYPAWTGYLINGAGSFFEMISVGLFVPLLLFYFLYDKDNLLESFNGLIGRHCYLPKLNSELPKMIRAFAGANLVTGLLLFVLHVLTLYLLEFNNWLPLALITAVTSLIPIVGAPLSILLALTQGVVQTETLFPFILMGLLFFGFHVVTGNLVLPQLIGSRVNVNTAALIFGLLFWGWLWGAMGFVLAVPMTALIKIFLESNPDTVPVANLLSAKPKHVLRGSMRDINGKMILR